MKPNVLEGGAPGKALIALKYPEKVDVTLRISTYPPGVLSAPKSVSIPAGKTTATFSFRARNDNLTNLDRYVSFTLSIPRGDRIIDNETIVYDDEPAPSLTLSKPDDAVEFPRRYLDHLSKIVLDRAPTGDGYITITATPADEVESDGRVYFRKGRKVGYFSYDAKDDDKIDGNIKIVFKATAAGKVLAKTSAHTIDNESRQIRLTLPPEIHEGEILRGSVEIGGYLPSSKRIKLTSNDPGNIRLPTHVTVAAGSTLATFDVAAIDNKLLDGTKTPTVKASATGLVEAARTISIRDNEVAGFSISETGDLAASGLPRTITVTAVDIQGNQVRDYSGPVRLSLVSPTGIVAKPTPETVNLNFGIWKGSVTFTDYANHFTAIRATDPRGLTGETRNLSTIRALHLSVHSMLWNEADQRIYASVTGPTHSPYKDHVVLIDPKTLNISESIPIGRTPNIMEKTHGGEYLYVASHSDGTISKINLASKTVELSFGLGTDSSGGKLVAWDMCAVEGQPDTLVVSRGTDHSRLSIDAVAAYDDGQPRQLMVTSKNTPGGFSASFLEPSADPTVFYGDMGLYGSSQFRLDSNGVTLIKTWSSLLDRNEGPQGSVLPYFVSRGNLLYSTKGVVADGQNSDYYRHFHTNGLVFPDTETGRVYFVEPRPDNISGIPDYGLISSYDTATGLRVATRTMKTSVASPANLIKWGKNGLAFSSPDRVYFFNDPGMVPSSSDADLDVRITTQTGVGGQKDRISHRLTVTNKGPNVASGANVTASLSKGESVSTVSATSGIVTPFSSDIKVELGDLPPLSSATVTIHTVAPTGKIASCRAKALTDSIDREFSNNIAVGAATLRFNAVQDVLNQIPLHANNLLYDTKRRLLWASIPGNAPSNLARHVLAIDPLSGRISNLTPIFAEPRTDCMTISKNFDYLYIGTADIGGLLRIRISATPHEVERIPLGRDNFGSIVYANHVESLTGDGTSVIVSTTRDRSAMVVDGMVPRPQKSRLYSAAFIGSTRSPDVFVGLDDLIEGGKLTRLYVTPEGITDQGGTMGSDTAHWSVVASGGDRLVTPTGLLYNTESLARIKNLGLKGTPWVDPLGSRIFFLSLYSYAKSIYRIRLIDPVLGQGKGYIDVPIPPVDTSYPEENSDSAYLRDFLVWGADGCAVLARDGAVSIQRSAFFKPLAQVKPEGRRTKATPVAVDFPPESQGLQSSASSAGSSSLAALNLLKPANVSISEANGSRIITFRFNRSKDSQYRFETSFDLINWEEATHVMERMISTRMIGDDHVEIVEASVRMENSPHGFVRICHQAESE